MKLPSFLPHLAGRRGRRSVVVATLLLAWLPASAAVVILDFEGVPDQYHEFGGGENLGNHYSGLPNGPVFGPHATILTFENPDPDYPYPPSSGEATLWTPVGAEGYDGRIEVTFAQPVAAVSVYYRSNSPLYLFAYSTADVLLGQVSGPDNLAPDEPAEYLTYSTGLLNIGRVSIQDSGNFFVIDDFSYNPIPEPHALGLIAGLGLTAFAVWRRRRA